MDVVDVGLKDEGFYSTGCNWFQRKEKGDLSIISDSWLKRRLKATLRLWSFLLQVCRFRQSVLLCIFKCIFIYIYRYVYIRTYLM